MALSQPAVDVGPDDVSAAASERPLRVAVVGVSTDPICGVRDHAALLAQALGERGVSCTSHWLSRRERSLGGSQAEIREWTRGLTAELAAHPPDAVLLHYSAFTYSFRGVPLFVWPVLAALRPARAPLVTMLHEYAYPWGRGGLRGATWALTQRAFLLELARRSAALVVTADFRARQLASRRWLPPRRTAVAPVFSNLPAPRPRASTGEAELGSPSLGLFGYASEGTAMTLVLDALRLLWDGGHELRLRLLGAPGAESASGRAWSAAAGARGLSGALSFSGTLPAQELADALAECELLLLADPSGPTSRKTTLAASLASGSAVVALDGPNRWQALIDAQAASVVAASARALAAALGTLLDDGALRAAIGARGRAFARREMSVERSAQVLAQLLRAIA